MRAFVSAVVGVALCGAGLPAQGLFASVRLEAGGKRIDTEIGHAAPFVGDFDGDRVQDLLAGCGDGSVQLSRNVGDHRLPVLARPFTLETPP